MHITALLAAFDLAAFWSLLPVRLVLISGVVYVLVQAVKTIYPGLVGWKAMVLNGALSLTGVLSVAKPGDLASAPFWASLLMTVAAAAGIHGTVRSLATGASADPAAPTPNPPVLVKAILLGVALSGVGLLAGCGSAKVSTPPTAPTLTQGAIDSTDANAYRTLRPAHDFAASITSDVQAGKLHLAPTGITALESLNKALNIADHAEQTYHTSGGSNAAALSTAVTAVLQAWTSTQAALTP
jgi:hypothetical protein